MIITGFIGADIDTYIANDTRKCISCESSNARTIKSTVINKYVINLCYCPDCLTKWQDTYQLTSVERLT